MKNQRTALFYFFSFTYLFVLLSSCAVKNNHYYVPPENNVLTLNEKHDFQISGSTSFKDQGISTIQIGYSPIQHLGIVGSWMRQNNGKGIYPFDVSGVENSNTANYKSLAVGGYIFKKKDIFYRTFIPKKYLEQAGLLVDFYFGMGEGSFRRDYNTFRSYVEFDHRKVFGRVGVHYKFRSLGVSYVYKTGQLQVNNLLVHGNFIMFPKNIFDELKVDNTLKTYESTFRVEYGIKEAKLNLSLTTFSDQFQIFTPLRSYYSLGLVVNIDEFFRKRNKEK